jgi:hypothetical protein
LQRIRARGARRHARPSMSLDVYSHIMPADEVAADKFMSLIDERK